MSKTVLIYDGDMVAFRVAAGIEERKVKVTSKRTWKSAIYKNKTEHKKLVLAAGKEYDPEQLVIEEIRKSLPAVFGCNMVDAQIKKTNEALFADEYLICISGKLNFRDSLPLPSKYKGSRTTIVRPEHLRAIKLHLMKKHPSVIASNREADDDLIIKGYEYLAKGDSVILVQQDKDAFAYSGLSLYDYTQESPELVLVPDFGALTVEQKVSGKQKINKVKGKGFIWFCFQWIRGDVTDDYLPYELASKMSGVSFGEMGAYNVLKDCGTEQEALEAVVGTFKKWYPEPFVYTDWQGNEVNSSYVHMLSLYFRCARMMTHENDTLDAVEFLESKGIEL